MPDNCIPVQRVSQSELREIFNREQFWERTLSGELRVEVEREGTPSVIQPDRIPEGSVSQEVRYYDQNNVEVARVHQYIKPDGTIGGWGRPDPRRLLLNGTLYRMHRTPGG